MKSKALSREGLFFNKMSGSAADRGTECSFFRYLIILIFVCIWQFQSHLCSRPYRSEDYGVMYCVFSCISLRMLP